MAKEDLWGSELVEEVVEHFQPVLTQVQATAAFVRVGEDYELEHEALLRRSRGPLDTLHLFVFLESPDGHTSPDALLRQERIIESEADLLRKQEVGKRWVEVHTVVLPYPMIDGKEMKTLQQYMEEFHMGLDHQQVYPSQNQAPR